MFNTEDIFGEKIKVLSGNGGLTDKPTFEAVPRNMDHGVQVIKASIGKGYKPRLWIQKKSRFLVVTFESLLIVRSFDLSKGTGKPDWLLPADEEMTQLAQDYIHEVLLNN